MCPSRHSLMYIISKGFLSVMWSVLVCNSFRRIAAPYCLHSHGHMTNVTKDSHCSASRPCGSTNLYPPTHTYEHLPLLYYHSLCHSFYVHSIIYIFIIIIFIRYGDLFSTKSNLVCPIRHSLLYIISKWVLSVMCGEWKCPLTYFAQVTQHLCYHQALQAKDTTKFKYLFFDFESRQDSIRKCTSGYKTSGKNCITCVGSRERCSACRLCINCSVGKGVRSAILQILNPKVLQVLLVKSVVQ